MSNQVQRAINSELNGLYIGERDVNAILRRVRTEAAPAPRPRQPVRFGMVLALAMVMLLVGVSVNLVRMGTQQQENLPLSQQGGALTPDAVQSVIDLAEAYIHAHHDTAVDLRDETVYRIDCTEADSTQIVTFRALNEFATEYTVSVHAAAMAVTDCQVQRGVGEGHTAEEIRIGYSRVYGSDLRLWTQEQLHAYSAMLRKADESSLRWNDLLTMQTGYVSVRNNALSREQIAEAVLAPLQTSQPQFVNAEPIFEAGTVWTVLGEPRIHYLNASPNPVWKAAVDLTVTAPDGYVSQQVLLVEADSVTGEIVHADAVSLWEAAEQEMHLQSTIDAMQQVCWASDEVPTLAEEEALGIAESYIRTTYTASLNPAQYTVKIDNSDFRLDGNRPTLYANQIAWKVLYTPADEQLPSYCVYVDFFGNVVHAGSSLSALDELRYLATEGAAYPQDYQLSDLTRIQALIAEQQLTDDPVAAVFAATTYVGEEGRADYLTDAAASLLGVRTCTVYRGTNIASPSGPVQKLALDTEKGRFLVEINDATQQPVSIVQVESFLDPWYAPFLLQADMEAAGIAPAPYTLPQYGDAAVDSGVVMGMWINHIHDRYQKLYGPDMLDWSQEQLRAFREDAILSNDVGGDMGVMCLRATSYPDVPAGAISRETAAKLAAESLTLTEYTYEGAVLIGTEGTPVWKVCLSKQDGSFWYIQVNCMTGEVTSTPYQTHAPRTPAFFCPCYDDEVYDEYWYRDIVLEETIEECEKLWRRTSNG